MTSFLFSILKLICLFLIEEIKISKRKIFYIFTFLKEVNLFNYLQSKYIKEKNEIFKIDSQNTYLKLLKKTFYNQKKIYSSQKVFIESFINHPSYTIPNCFISSIISKNKNIELNGILRKGDIKGTQILNSFGIKKIIFINEGNIFLRFYFFLKSFTYLRKLSSVDQLLKLKIDKIDFGQAIYEQFIRFKKNPDIYKIHDEFYVLLGKALLLDYQFKKIFKNQNKSLLVQSETQYFPFRISFQNALKFNLKVFSKRGISMTGLRIYKNFNERNENRNKISKEIFNIYYRSLKKRYIKKIYKFHSDRINQTLGKDIYHKINNKKNSKIIINNKMDFCKKLNLKENYPIVLILAHELTDGNLVNKWNIFQNDMFFLRETLTKIKKLKKINWIIKPHPSEEIFKSKITTHTLFDNYSKNFENVRLLPKNYNIKNPKKIYHCAITSHGTAGYEYPSFGIPTIICGDTPYSQLGFNLEPKNKSEYFLLLNKIKYLRKLKKKQITKSKLFYYLFNELFVVKNPLMHETDITMKYNKEEFWFKSISNLKHINNNNHFINCINHLINNNNSLLIDIKKDFIRNGKF